VSLGYLAFFATGGGLGDSGDLSAAGGFNAFGCGSTGCIFRLPQSAAHRGVGVFGLMIAGCL